jgi:hypothetical protein
MTLPLYKGRMRKRIKEKKVIREKSWGMFGMKKKGGMKKRLNEI